MAISLFDLSVANYLQTLGAVEGFLAKGLAHFQEAKADPDAVLGERLHADMLPFKFQVWATAHHSLGAINGVKEGVFGPPAPIPATIDYAGLQKTVTEAREALQKVKPEEVDAVQGKDMTFQLPTMKIPFTAENFLLSFSLPNFYFHATTAYDILRNKGVPLGKRDFMGRLRLKK
ncbi:DUF1993 domain-containing protein [Reyranella sp.]|uniref:DUF1993 domain-containing protein n=1 Tax=Reyranella sp. TaxID=1929291 RepID=UPI003BABA06A